MKKSVSLLLSLTLAGSLMAGSAFAATNQEEFDSLKAAGIVTGYPDGSAGLNQQMTRAEFAKVLSTLNGLSGDAASAAKYTDLPGGASYWALPYIGAATKAGLVSGISVNKFDPAGKVTLEQVAKTLVISLGLQESSSDVGGESSTWAKGYVSAAVNAGLLDKGLNYKAPALRGQLFHAAYTAYQQISVKVTKAEATDASTVVVTFSDNATETQKLTTPLVAGQETTVSVTHNGVTYPVKVTYNAPAVDAAITGAKKIDVKFGSAIADTSKVDATVKKGANTVTVASKTWSEDKKTLTLTLASNVSAGTYDVSVTGVATDAVVKSLTATDPTVSKIEITSDFASLVDGSDADALANDKLIVGYKVYNQYGEDVTSTTDLATPSSSGGVATITNKGTVEIQSSGTLAVDSNVSLTLIHVGSSTTTTKLLKVSAEAKVADVTATLWNKDNKTLTADSTPGDFYIVLNVKDQYGRDITDAAKIQSELLVSVANTNVASVAGYNATTNKATVSNANINDAVSNEVYLTVNGPLTAGSSVITLISPATGKSTSLTLNVANGVKANDITVGDVGLVAAGETIDVPVTVTDMSGAEIKDVSVLNQLATAKGITVSGAATVNSVTPGFVKLANGSIVYRFSTAANTADSYATLTFLTANNKVQVKNIAVKATAVPKVIVGLDSDVNTLIFKGQNLTIAADKLIVQDQYGRTMTDAKFTGALGAAAANYQVQVSQDTNNNAVQLAADAANVSVNSAGGSVVLTGANKGSESLTFTLRTNSADVASSTFSQTFRTVEQGELTSYGVDDIGKVLVNGNAAYQRTLSVYGTTSDGKKVALPASAYNLAVSGVAGLAATAGGNGVDASGVSTAANGPFGTDKSEVTGKVTVTINATGDQFVKDVVVTKTAAAVDVLEIRENGASTANYSVPTATVAGTFDVNDLATLLYAKDQYGVDAASIAVNSGEIVITLKDGSTVKPSIVISNVIDGKADATAPAITNNGLTTASIANVGAGDSFDLTVIAGSKQAKVHVVVY